MRLDGEYVGELVRWIGHDAVIYHGNSGGPLVNLRGEIVGVNEVGIGSLGGAIPSNLARKVAEELMEHGRVRRSWSGLVVQPLLKSSDADAGVLVGGVVEGSPGDEAGIRAGDVISKFGGREIAESRAPEDIPVFNRILLETPVGASVPVEGFRNGEPMKWMLTTREREPARPRERELASWGITVRDLTDLEARKMLREDSDAVVVQSVRKGGRRPPRSR